MEKPWTKQTLNEDNRSAEAPMDNDGNYKRQKDKNYLPEFSH